jgi:hypothetical protein
LPKANTPCVVAAQKPKLDGQLDDLVWSQARPTELRSALLDDAAWPAVAMLAYDAEFLYLAVTCRKAPGVPYDNDPQPRPRDADLSGFDRVDIMLDVDRDWGTYYRLTLDHRGWTRESCWSDLSWNPDWYVASQNDDDTWTAEAAIPWAALAPAAPGHRDSWALGIQRTVPGVGFQSWTQPSSTSVVPEGFGYLLFE